MTLYIGNDEVSKKIILENISVGGIDLPEISEVTKGKILGNDGSILNWVDESDYISSKFNETLNMSYITNCITKIPQDIKLELSDGKMTLKAGSKLYKPDSTFVTINSDKIRTATYADAIAFYDIDNDVFSWCQKTECYSQDTTPTYTQYMLWYDTANNTVKVTNDTGATWSECTLPICEFTADSTKITSIDQVFNGFGYIGNTIFALPGIEGLIPNGRNIDGSLNNIKFTTTSVLTGTTVGTYNGYIVMSSSVIAGWAFFNSEYDFENNINKYRDTKNNVAIVGTLSVESGCITSFNPKSPIKLADDQEVVHNIGDEEIAGIKEFKDYIIAPNQVDYTQITNCITKIPQDIKFELVDGALTLKAGSKIYDGAGNPISIIKDYIVDITNSNGVVGVYYSQNQDKIWANQPMSLATSGNIPPEGTGMFYNTSTKSVDFYSNGSISDANWSLPLAIITTSNGALTTINQIFNGFGYIGSTIFALPGVEGLIPNGRNIDGSLNNIKFTTTNLLTYTYPSTVFSFLIGVNNTNLASDKYVYNQDENYNRNPQGVVAPRAMFATVSTDSTGRITSFNPKTTFQAVDRNDTEWASTASKPSDRYVGLTLQASGASYTAPANGWFYTKYTKNSETATQSMILGFTNEDIDGLGNFITMGMNSLVTNTYYKINQPIKAGKKMRFSYQKANANDTIILGFCYDEGAK